MSTEKQNPEALVLPRKYPMGQTGHIVWRYAIDDGFEDRIRAQEDRCPIGNHLFIGRGSGKHAPARDHCHATGKDRAILCIEHNRALGAFHDSPEELQAAVEYVLVWRKRHADS